MTGWVGKVTVAPRQLASTRAPVRLMSRIIFLENRRVFCKLRQYMGLPRSRQASDSPVKGCTALRAWSSSFRGELRRLHCGKPWVSRCQNGTPVTSTQEFSCRSLGSTVRCYSQPSVWRCLVTTLPAAGIGLCSELTAWESPDHDSC